VFLISYPKWFRAHPTIFSITCWRSSGSTPSGRRRIVEPSVSPPHLAMARSGYRWPLWQARHLEGRSQLSARQVENEASYRMTPPSGFDAGSDIGNVRLREVGGPSEPGKAMGRGSSWGRVSFGISRCISCVFTRGETANNPWGSSATPPRHLRRQPATTRSPGT
jgi:hypothetical protein